MELNYTPGLTLPERAVSAFPLSIGTSLAFESVFPPSQAPYDPKREIPNRVDLSKYQTCWVNLTTLFRNLVSAITREGFEKATPAELAATIEEEFGVIQSLFQTEGQGHCQVKLYYSTYEKLLTKRVPGLVFRLPHTEVQKFYHEKLEKMIKILEKHTDSIVKFNDAIVPTTHEHAFALTHQPYDLVDYKKFAHLDLLESNTGVLKPRARWNSKYYPMSGQSFVHLPFHKKLLLIMGDKVLVRPAPAILRKQILETSLKRNWTPMTTEAKIVMDLGLDVKDPYMMAVINSI